MVYVFAFFYFLIQLPILFFLCSKSKKKSDVQKKNSSTDNAKKNKTKMPQTKSQTVAVAAAHKKKSEQESSSSAVQQRSDTTSKPELIKTPVQKVEKKATPTTPATKKNPAAEVEDDLKFGPPPEDEPEETELASLKDIINPLMDRKIQARLTRPRENPKIKPSPSATSQQKEPTEADSDVGSEKGDPSHAPSTEKSDSDKEKKVQETQVDATTSTVAGQGPVVVCDSIMLAASGYRNTAQTPRKRPSEKNKSQKEMKPSTTVPTPPPPRRISSSNGRLSMKKNKKDDTSAYL